MAPPGRLESSDRRHVRDGLRGLAAATPAFDLELPVHHAIHTAGLIWEGGGYGEAGILASYYRRSLQAVDTLSARCITLLAFAVGIYGYPPDRAAKIAVETIRSTPAAVKHVRLVAFGQPARDILQAALNL